MRPLFCLRLLSVIILILTVGFVANGQSALDGFDPNATNANGAIVVVVVQPDGKTLIGGYFTALSPNGVASFRRNHIARLNPDGTVDAAFDPNANDPVFAIALQADGKILVAGNFYSGFGTPTIGGQTRNFIARLDATTGAADSWDPNANNVVESIAVQADGKILAGGLFNGPNSIGGQTRNRIARLDPTTGAADSFDPGPVGNIEVEAIAVQADGKVLIGGSFTQLEPNGGTAVTRNRIARLNADGTLDTAFNPNANQQVYTIVVQADGKILVGGAFSASYGVNTIGGKTRNFIARLDPVTGAADSFNPNANDQVQSIAVQPDGKVLACGFFNGANSIGGQMRNHIARLDAITGAADSFDPNATDNAAYAIAVQADGKVLVGGFFTILAPNGGGTVKRNRIARLETDGSLDQTLNLGIVGGFVDAIAVQPDGKTLIGGSFTSVLGVARNNIARLNADGTLDMTFDPNANNVVEAIAVQADGKILVGGLFVGTNSIGGQIRTFIARLDATTGAADSWNPNPSDEVDSIVVQADGQILAGGQFNIIGGRTRHRIARLDPVTGSADSFDPDANNVVYGIAVQADGKVLAGGNFSFIGGQVRNHIARLSSDGSLDTAFDPSANSEVDAIAVQLDGKILACGDFTIIGGQTRNFIARLDAITGAADSFDPNGTDDVFAIAVQADGKILIGGDFTSLSPNGGAAVTRNQIARLNPDGTVDIALDPSANNEVDSIALQADGKILVGGAFTTIGGQARNFFARLTNDTAALQDLTVTQTTITWTRAGAGAQFTSATFEESTDNGATYSFLGNGMPSVAQQSSVMVQNREQQLAPASSQTANYTLTGLNLPTGQNILIRARGYYSSGSESTAEFVQNVFIVGPTAANGSIGGTIADPSGTPVGGVTINLSGTESREAITDANGKYFFDSVETNGFYTLTPARANYTFSPANRSFSLLGAHTEASFTATRDGDQANAIDTTEFFVRQQYLDFLGREPDQGGFEYWNGQITQCGNDPSCVHNKRIDVSNAFFYELEYQQTAAYVFRLYRAAFGNSQPLPNPDSSNQTEAKKIPGYAAFAPDRALLIGSANLAKDQLTLANAFALRPEFLSKYPSNLTGPQFVDALLANIKSDSAADLTFQRDVLIAQFSQGGSGMVLYRVADDNVQTSPINNRAFIDAEYDRAFVASQYFGYLRRGSDIRGFLFWFGQVSSAPLRDISRQHAMVCSFITSAEYQLRFSTLVTHSNAECSLYLPKILSGR